MEKGLHWSTYKKPTKSKALSKSDITSILYSIDLYLLFWVWCKTTDVRIENQCREVAIRRYNMNGKRKYKYV